MGGLHRAGGFAADVGRFGVLPQLVVVSAFAVASPVEWSEPTVVLRYVSVPTTTIVSVHNRLRMNMSQWVTGLLLLHNEVTYKQKYKILGASYRFHGF